MVREEVTESKEVADNKGGEPEAKRKPRRPLTQRQREFLKGIEQGKSQFAAAVSAGYSRNVAARACRDITPSLGQKFEAALRKHLDMDKYARRIVEGLDAKETKFFSFQGKVEDEREVIAWSERRMYSELISVLIGVQIGRQRAAPAVSVSVNLQPDSAYVGAVCRALGYTGDMAGLSHSSQAEALPSESSDAEPTDGDSAPIQVFEAYMPGGGPEAAKPVDRPQDLIVEAEAVSNENTPAAETLSEGKIQ